MTDQEWHQLFFEIRGWHIFRGTLRPFILWGQWVRFIGVIDWRAQRVPTPSNDWI